uniref:Uncharacterized protein n=1 Tax=viral metagenome TaxID=1070528 RepID=A0A6C0HPZ1_9ZZZZ
MPIASQFILGMGIYITYLLFKSNYKDSIVKDTIQSIKDTYIQTLDLLEKYKDSCPNLINSFFFPWQKDNGFNEDLINLHNNDGELESLIVSNYIFQIVGLYTQASTMTSVSDSRFLIFFSSFFRSKLLKNKWDKFKINFGVRNVLLCDKLFEINEKYKFKNGEELKNYFENYVQTDEFIKIMTTVDTTNVTQRNSAIVQ